MIDGYNYVGLCVCAQGRSQGGARGARAPPTMQSESSIQKCI